MSSRCASKKKSELALKGENNKTFREPFSSKVKELARVHEGTVVYLFEVLRLFGCLDLVALSVSAFVFCPKGMHHYNGWQKSKEMICQTLQ